MRHGNCVAEVRLDYCVSFWNMPLNGVLGFENKFRKIELRLDAKLRSGRTACYHGKFNCEIDG